MAGGSGSNRTDKATAQPSASRSPEERKSGNPHHILIAEDNAADVGLVRMALRQHGIRSEVRVQKDGEEMLRYIDGIDAG